MSLVVSNTSPLTNLAAIGQFHLLRDLFGSMHIAEGVWDELNAGGQRWPGQDEVAGAGWIQRHAPANLPLITVLRQDLDRGESETIALALELNASLLILLDEREGRHQAARLGLKPMGVLGVLLTAKARGLVAETRPLLDALRQRAGFYISDALYCEVLKLAREANSP